MATKREKPFRMRGGFVCPSCRAVLPTIHPAFVAFFRGQTLICPRCKKALPPLWDLALMSLQEDFTFQRVYQLAGAKQTYDSAWVKADKNVYLNLDRHGVHKQAEILAEKYQSIGEGDLPFILPLRWEPSSNVPPHGRFIYGATWGRKTPPRLKLHISLTWIVPGREEISTHHLVDAVKQYAGRRYDAMTVPANVAAEAALAPVIRDWVTAFDPDWKTIARNAVQVNLLSLVVADTLRVPRLDAKIRKLLDELRGRRNSMGHAGKPDAHQRTLNATTAGELLTSAIFGFHYARFLGAAVGRLRRRRGLPARGK